MSIIPPDTSHDGNRLQLPYANVRSAHIRAEVCAGPIERRIRLPRPTIPRLRAPGDAIEQREAGIVPAETIVHVFVKPYPDTQRDMPSRLGLCRRGEEQCDKTSNDHFAHAAPPMDS